MNFRKPEIFLCGIAAVLFSGLAQGGIISVSGDIDTSNFGSQGTSGFANFGLNALTNNFAIQLYEERQNFTLISDLAVDSVGGANSDSPGEITAILSAGTTLSSYLLHYDRTTSTVVLNGTVEFDAEIIGLVYNNFDGFPSANLAGSDFLAKPGTLTFFINSARGMVRNESTDVWSIGADGRTLSLNMFVLSTSTDELRVLIAVPEPSSLSMLGLGLLGFVGYGRRTRSSRAT